MIDEKAKAHKATKRGRMQHGQATVVSMMLNMMRIISKIYVKISTISFFFIVGQHDQHDLQVKLDEIEREN